MPPSIYAARFAALLFAAGLCFVLPAYAQFSAEPNAIKNCFNLRRQDDQTLIGQMMSILKEDVQAEDQHTRDVIQCGTGPVAACVKAAQDRLDARRRQIADEKNADITRYAQALRDLEKLPCPAGGGGESYGGGGSPQGGASPQGVPQQGRSRGADCSQLSAQDSALENALMQQIQAADAEGMKQYNADVKACGTGHVAECIEAAKLRLVQRRQVIQTEKSEDIAMIKNAWIQLHASCVNQPSVK